MHELQAKMLRADRPAGAEPPEQERDADFTDTGRLVALCDGVFAIIITLLVLEIHRPSADPGSLSQELLNEWPSYIAYGVAFLYIGVIWLNCRATIKVRIASHPDCRATLNHQNLFDRLQKVDFGLNWSISACSAPPR
jgi:Endosomal/lysosomal potassium channel TMEM175